MKKVQWILSGAIIWLLAGCVSSGNPSIMNQSLMDQINLDLSTKEDVRRILGQPNSTSRSSGSLPFPGTTLTNVESWTYSHLDVAVDGATFIPIVGLFAGGATTDVNMFTVVFDDNGVVRHITTSQTQSQSGMKRAAPTNQSVK